MDYIQITVFIRGNDAHKANEKPQTTFSRVCAGDAAFRYRIENQQVPSYGELDVRLGWRPRPELEFSIVGQNLLHDHHTEFGDVAMRREIERGVYGKLVWRF